MKDFLIGIVVALSFQSGYLALEKYHYHKELAKNNEMLLCYYAGNPYGLDYYPCVRVKRGSGY